MGTLEGVLCVAWTQCLIPYCGAYISKPTSDENFSIRDPGIIIYLRFWHRHLLRISLLSFLFGLRSWTEATTVRSHYHMQFNMNGLAMGCFYFIALPTGQGRDRQPAQIGRSHTHQHRIKRRKKAVQALGRDVRFLVSITEPLHSRNAI